MSRHRPDAGRFDLDRHSRDQIALFLAEAALAAGPAVMEVYRLDAGAERKQDGSPVTEADHRAEAIICGYLCHVDPPTPVIAEELTAAGAPIRVAERFFLVDPVDGTREFLARNGEFTINAALIENGTPVAGAVYAPAIGRLWFGGDEAFVCDAPPGAGLPGESMRRRLRTRRAPSELVAVASRSHFDPECESFLKRLRIGEERSIGSSLKFCLVAEGSADVYPRFGPTMEWDTAAGDAVLRAAGGVVLDGGGKPLPYGKIADGLRNGPFVAWGDATAADRAGDR